MHKAPRSKSLTVLAIIGTCAGIAGLLWSFYSGFRPESVQGYVTLVFVFITILVLIAALVAREYSHDKSKDANWTRQLEEIEGLKQRHREERTAEQAEYEEEARASSREIRMLKRRLENERNGVGKKMTRLVLGCVGNRKKTFADVRATLNELCELASGVYTQRVGDHVTVKILLASVPTRISDTEKLEDLIFKVLGCDGKTRHDYGDERDDYSTVDNYYISKAVHDAKNPLKRLFYHGDLEHLWWERKVNPKLLDFSSQDFVTYGDPPRLSTEKNAPPVVGFNLPYKTVASMAVRTDLPAAGNVIIGLVIVRAKEIDTFSEARKLLNESVGTLAELAGLVLWECHELAKSKDNVFGSVAQTDEVKKVLQGGTSDGEAFNAGGTKEPT